MDEQRERGKERERGKAERGAHVNKKEREERGGEREKERDQRTYRKGDQTGKRGPMLRLRETEYRNMRWRAPFPTLARERAARRAARSADRAHARDRARSREKRSVRESLRVLNQFPNFHRGDVSSPPRVSLLPLSLSLSFVFLIVGDSRLLLRRAVTWMIPLDDHSGAE